MRAGYRRAIEWIAFNDETACMDADVMSGLISVVLVADLFGKDAMKVATDVIGVRRTDAALAGRS